MTEQLQKSPQLQSQLQELLTIHAEISDRLYRLETRSSRWPHEVVSDLERIQKTSRIFGELLENLRIKRPDPQEDIFAFWSKQRHDLRTPINGIKNYSEMILEEDEKNTINMSDFSEIIQLAESTLPIIGEVGKDFKEPEPTDFIMTTPEDNEAWYVREGGTVLIIDDSSDNREVLKRRITRAGLTVLEAMDGFEGLKVVEENNIDLILLDIMMPRMDGYEVLDQLKSKEYLSHIPVLMISSVGELSSIVRCIEAGADDYLPTPFNPVLLKARISSCLEKKRHIDKEKAFTHELETAQGQLEAAIESIDEGFAIFDAHDKLVKYNIPFKKLYADLFSLGLSEISYDTFLRENLANGAFSTDRRLKETPKDWMDRHEMWHEDPHKPLIERLIPMNAWIEIQEYKTPDGGTVSIHKDISKRKEEEEMLSYLALHDSLTGIGNRAQFEKFLEETLRQSWEGGIYFSVLFLDLDGFKAVNDTLGHEFGDHLLITVADRIQSCIRFRDIAARLGGDEFSVLLPNSQDLETTKLIAQRIIESIGTSVSHEGETAEFGVSIGIASFPGDGQTTEEILKAADDAMYAAKKAGKGQYKVYSEMLKAS